MMRTVAIIPARGGSKGIPRKNIIDFCGYPLVSWTIACARRCPRIDAVYVSTDDAEIAEVSRHYGAEIIERPANIAGDTSSSESAVIHACEVIRQKNLLPDAVIMMQATSPLREAGARSKWSSHGSYGFSTVSTRASFPPYVRLTSFDFFFLRPWP